MRIGVLTGGSDSPGMNAAIRAVVRTSDLYGYQVMGIHHGWQGMMQGRMELMANKAVSGIIQRGGTILSTSRLDPFEEEEGFEKLMKAAERARIDALIAVGGIETMKVLPELAKRGLKVIGIPKTIDNDVGETDNCIGFDTAVQGICDALDKLHTTAASHDRVMIVEVMGGDTGWLALYGGMAGGADWIMIPEIPTSLEELNEHLVGRRRRGRNFSIVVVAEGAVITDIPKAEEGSVEMLSIGLRLHASLERLYGWETRSLVLGHLQRGGSPTVFDRNLATLLSVKAVRLLREGAGDIMVGFRNNDTVPVDLDKVLKVSPRHVSRDLYEIAKIFY
ncbi:MAG: 6-phosphofructokinase [Chloroflexi bacterium]|nr:6-phosphofructokinase [Chloroflexota bacterium]